MGMTYGELYKEKTTRIDTNRAWTLCVRPYGDCFEIYEDHNTGEYDDTAPYVVVPVEAALDLAQQILAAHASMTVCNETEA